MVTKISPEVIFNIQCIGVYKILNPTNKIIQKL